MDNSGSVVVPVTEMPLNYFLEVRAQDGFPGTGFFLARKLWDAGNSAPYGHRGDLSTLFEAILAHGGEGRASRDDYLALPEESRKDVVLFLKPLQVVDLLQRQDPRRLGEFRAT